MITFDQRTATLVRVKLHGRSVGKINKDEDGWRYYPNGSSKKGSGMSYASLEACKWSLTHE